MTDFLSAGLAATPLLFGKRFPSPGPAGDFHLQGSCHAWRTKQKGAPLERQGNRVKEEPNAETEPRTRGPHKNRHCEPASFDAGEAIQGVFMMYSPWIASSLRSSQ